MIEINDRTHLQNNRRERDIKVRDICEKAKIPLITFWTDKPNEESYIQYRIDQAIQTLNL